MFSRITQFITRSLLFLLARARSLLHRLAPLARQSLRQLSAWFQRSWILLQAWSRGGGPRRLLRGAWRLPLLRVPLLAVAVAALTLVLVRTGFSRVPVGKIGVRQINWGPDSGIVERDFQSGLYWTFSPRSSWHWIDAQTAFLRFAWKSEGGSFAPLEVRTKEGNTAQIAVTVPYRVQAERAHKIVLDGAKATYASQAKAVVESSLLQVFADCSTEELYSSQRCAELSALALERIQGELAALHLEAMNVLISGIWFPATYEKKLQEMQLLSQDRLTNQAQQALADVSWEAQLLEEDIGRAEASVQKEIVAALSEEEQAHEAALAAIARETASNVARLRAEGDSTFARSTAAGKLAVAQAEAEGERLMNLALDTGGGRLMLAREAAGNLKFESITLDSSDPRVPSMLDLDALVALLVGKE